MINAASAGSVHTKNPGDLAELHRPDSGRRNLATTLDQLIAKKIGQETTLPSLQVSSETTNQQAAGNGTATATTVSFRDANTPLPMEYNPKKVFNELFGVTTPVERVEIAKQTDSLLDLILDRTKTLQSQLGAADRTTLDGYLESVREIERQTQLIAATDTSKMKIPERPVGVLDDFDKQVDLLFDLIAIAYQADITRVVSYIMVAEGTNQTYNHIGVPDSFHPVSHHANDLERINKLVKIQTWHMDRFAAFLKKMADTTDGDGSLLDHSIFMYGSNMGNSDQHNNYPIPTVIVGGGNGKMKQGGQHIVMPERTPFANVHLTLLNKAGIETGQVRRQHRHHFSAVVVAGGSTSGSQTSTRRGAQWIAADDCTLWASPAGSRRSTGGCRQAAFSKLTDKIAVVDGGGSNVVAFSTGDGLLLVDSGVPKYGDKLVAALKGRCRQFEGQHSFQYSLPSRSNRQ